MDEALERDVRAACDGGDHARAATLALRGYGPELYSFVAALHASADDADDVFAAFTATLWQGLPKFRWEASLRTWAYTLARNASHRHRRGERRDRARVDLDDPAAAALAVEIRTATKPYLRTHVKSRFAELRAELSIEDQELLVLRVDREMAWNDLALALADEELDATGVRREAARLRKRFQLLKERLLEAGRREGLVG